MFNPLIYRCLAYWTIVVILRCHSWSQPPNVIESESISICSKQHAFHNWWSLMVVLFGETKRLLDAMMQVSTLPAAIKMYLSGKNRETVWFSICIHLPLCSYWLHRSTGEHIIIHDWKDQRWPKLSHYTARLSVTFFRKQVILGRCQWLLGLTLKAYSMIYTPPIVIKNMSWGGLKTGIPHNFHGFITIFPMIN